MFPKRSLHHYETHIGLITNITKRKFATGMLRQRTALTWTKRCNNADNINTFHKSDTIQGGRSRGDSGGSCPSPALDTRGQRGGRKMPFCDVG